MPRFSSALCLSLWLLLPLWGVDTPALGQSALVTDGMITPKDATAEADIVVVQVRTAEDAPGPPVVVSLDPPRLLLSSQVIATGVSPAEPQPQNVGKLAPGLWQTYSYEVDWNDQGGEPEVDGFSDPASFAVTRGEVYPQRMHPTAGEAFYLRVDGPWQNSCVPEIDQVLLGAPSRVVILARRTDSVCLPENDRPSRFLIDAPVGPLAAGRYEVEVRVPDDSANEIYATASFRVVPAGEPRILEVWIQPDLERGGNQLAVEIEIPNTQTPGGCSSWRVLPRKAWVHGRDLYGQFELEQIVAPCEPTTVSTFRIPLPDLETGLYRILLHRDEVGAPDSESGDSEFWAQSPTLVASQQLSQMIEGRFQVTVTWRDHSNRTGRGVPVTREEGRSAIFSFFREDNWELLVKVLDGCALNNHFWVFASASTNVEYTLRVEDVLSGATATYRNELGTPSPAITDTMALAICE